MGLIEVLWLVSTMPGTCDELTYYVLLNEMNEIFFINQALKYLQVQHTLGCQGRED